MWLKILRFFTFNHRHFFKKDMIVNYYIYIITEVDTLLQHMVMAVEQET